MTSFSERFSKAINGILSGFDRIVFRGSLRSFSYPKGMLMYLCHNKVLLKDFTEWAKPKTESLKEKFAQDAKADGHEVVYLRRSSESKEEMARGIQEIRKVNSGIIGSFSCVEPCRNWTIGRNSVSKQLEARIETGQCLHLYRYWDHDIFGFMHVRLQTWFPFSIQICMNGREFLKRQLHRRKIGYEMYDNSFTNIDNWPLAQQISDRMLNMDWPAILERFSNRVFPFRRKLVGNCDYQWSVWQSEWATDHTMLSKDVLARIYPAIQRHAVLNSDAASVLRFLGNSVNVSGCAFGRLKAEVTTRLVRRQEGTCIKHQVGRNGLKTYDKSNNLRVEMTMNDPKPFRVFRPAGKNSKKPKVVPLRKSVVDIKRRAEICQKINDRYLEHLASASNDLPFGEVAASLANRSTWHGEEMRGMDLTSKDRVLVEFLANPSYVVNGMKNADLRKHLIDSGLVKNKTTKQIASMATRYFRLLRSHGVIRKMPKSHRYQITSLGNIAVTTVKSALGASAEKLMMLAA